jgi:hypothetical protein
LHVLLHSKFKTFHEMFRPNWPSSSNAQYIQCVRKFAVHS